MGLYEDDIDWDADLFGKLNARKLESDRDALAAGTDDDDDGGWEQVVSETKKYEGGEGAKRREEQRKQMEQAWGPDGSQEEEGKPTANWMPRFRKGPDEDEPWFTG